MRGRPQAPRAASATGRRRSRAHTALSCTLAAFALLLLLACSSSGRPAANSAATGGPATPPTGAATQSAAPAPTVPPAREAACGAAASATIASAAGAVAERIYGAEVSSAEVAADRHQVQNDARLLAALRGGRGVRDAVERLVFSHTHIVRLRVTQGSRVLADVGGPYILAPVSGTLHAAGRSLARYTLSVQDDAGYIKLETRFIGAPLVLRAGARRLNLEGTASPGPLPDHGPVQFAGSPHETFSFAARSFPDGPLRITLLVPVPGRPSALGCAVVHAEELGAIARRMWQRFASVGAAASSYVVTTGGYTGTLVYVRAGSRRIAGSISPGPSSLPQRGAVRFRGRVYLVTSFAARTAVGAGRIYLLARR